MLSEFSRKRFRKLQSVFIIVMALLTIGICVLSQGNTIHARETNDDEQTTQHAAAMTIENKSEDQTSPTVHILAFGLVIVVSAATAGILIAVLFLLKFLRTNTLYLKNPHSRLYSFLYNHQSLFLSYLVRMNFR